MKKFIISLVLVSGTFLFSRSQNIQQSGNTVAVAVPVSQGVWVYLGNTIPKNIKYRIERKKENASSFEKLGETSSPANKQEMQKRQETYQLFFSNLDSISVQELDNLWKYIQRNQTTDSMDAGNLPMAHLLAGTGYFDKTADKNTSYVYRISRVSNDGKIISQQQTNPSLSYKKPVFPEIRVSKKRYAGGKLTLTWAVPDPLSMSHFNIYRSVFGKENYVKIGADKIEKGIFSENDSLKLIAIDILGKQPAWYEYQIAPVDAFGNEGEKQGYISGGNIESYYAPPVTYFTAVSGSKNHEIKLYWHFENKKYLNGVTIMRSRNYDSGYIRISTVPVEDTTFTDILPITGENYYYYLLLNSAGNHPVPSAKVFVAYTGSSESPAPPEMVQAVTIPGGIRIFWKHQNVFHKGFYVYRRAGTNENFIQVSSLIHSGNKVYSFTDTSHQLLGSEVYEYVIKTMNEDGQMSVNSDTVTAHPGIKMTPAAPMNVRYRTNDNAVTIIWDDMSRWVNNLSGYKVYRKANNGLWTRLENDSIQPMKNFYVDSSAKFHDANSYAVVCWDYFGNESEKSEIDLPASEEPLTPPPPGITVSQSENDIYISWGQMTGNISKFQIYRSGPGQVPVLTGTADAGDESFIDKNVIKGKLYFYQISTVNQAGKEGPLSEKIAVRIR